MGYQYHFCVSEESISLHRFATHSLARYPMIAAVPLEHPEEMDTKKHELIGAPTMTAWQNNKTHFTSSQSLQMKCLKIFYHYSECEYFTQFLFKYLKITKTKTTDHSQSKQTKRNMHPILYIYHRYFRNASIEWDMVGTFRSVTRNGNEKNTKYYFRRA